jgi:DNA-binding NarL/FixJ family response regulator
MPEDPVRILIVEDNGVYRRGLRAQISLDSRVEVVGEATTAEESVAAAVRLRPSVTLMDLRLPKSEGDEPSYCGVDAIRQIRRQVPDAVIVALTMYHEDYWVPKVIDSGAHGYLVKDADESQIVQSVILAADGMKVFGRPTEMDRILAPSDSGNLPFPQLSQAERETLELVARGKDNPEIARITSLATKTIANRITTIREKLAARTRHELIAKARDAGMGGGPEANGFPVA